MHTIRRIAILLVGLLVSFQAIAEGAEKSGAASKLKALIIDGQNNHRNWPATTKMMTKYLQQSGRFTVDIARTAPKGVDDSFKPQFSKYDVVISNYNGAMWPEETRNAFVDYMKKGGGFVSIHAADNAFGGWREYNEIIGLGGWGGRNERSGPYVYYDDNGKLIRDESKGRGGSHGPQHAFSIVVRNEKHPITNGMPREWLHVKDELYDSLRGPAGNMNVLATAFSTKTKRHEPMIFTVSYGKGRVLHTPMGHGNYSQECVGFIVTLLRGAEWAATGKVTMPIPKDFPTAAKVSQRKFTE